MFGGSINLSGGASLMHNMHDGAGGNVNIQGGKSNSNIGGSVVLSGGESKEGSGSVRLETPAVKNEESSGFISIVTGEFGFRTELQPDSISDYRVSQVLFKKAHREMF